MMAEDYAFSAEDLNREFADELGPGEEWTQEDLEEIKIEGLPSSRPSFPLVTFVFAVLIDTVKLCSFGFLGIITAILGFILVRVYLFGKMGFIKRFVYQKTIVVVVKNIIPFVGAFLGSWSWFILRVHSKNYKRINQIIMALEKLA